VQCPIAHEIMADPVVAADGHTYERSYIKEWLSEHDTSPMTMKRLKHKKLTPNDAMVKTIQNYYRDYGIPEKEVVVPPSAVAGDEEEGGPPDNGGSGNGIIPDNIIQKDPDTFPSSIVPDFGNPPKTTMPWQQDGMQDQHVPFDKPNLLAPRCKKCRIAGCPGGSRCVNTDGNGEYEVEG